MNTASVAVIRDALESATHLSDRLALLLVSYLTPRGLLEKYIFSHALRRGWDAERHLVASSENMENMPPSGLELVVAFSRLPRCRCLGLGESERVQNLPRMCKSGSSCERCRFASASRCCCISLRCSIHFSTYFFVRNIPIQHDPKECIHYWWHIGSLGRTYAS